MKSIIGMLAAMSLIGHGDYGTRDRSGNNIVDSLNEKKPKVIPPNHKEFTIEGITVTALSKKRAIEKVEKILKRRI